MVLTERTRGVINDIKKHPTLIKNESIIDGITGVHAIAQINRPYLISVFGMDGFVIGGLIGLFLTPSRIILYYQDVVKNHQFCIYPIEKIENIELIIVGAIKKALQVKFYMGGTFMVVGVEHNEAANEFVENVKKCISSQLSINCDNNQNIGENGIIYCMKCGTKLPHDAIFCMKCGEKINT